MVGRELIHRVRNEMLRDRLIGAFENDEFNLWRNDELLRFLNEALEEACLRSRIIVDSDTSAICDISVVDDTHTYALDSRIHKIERAKLALRNTPLREKSSVWLDENILDWEIRDGSVEYYLVDENMSAIRLVGIPDESDTLNLRVWRGPLVQTLFDTAPEIKEVHQRHLLHWVCHMAYLKEDTNTFNQKKSDYHAGMFASFFGDRVDAETLEQRRRAYPMRVAARFL